MVIVQSTLSVRKAKVSAEKTIYELRRFYGKIGNVE